MCNMAEVQDCGDRGQRVERRDQENSWNNFCEISLFVQGFHLCGSDVIHGLGAFKDTGQGRQLHIP